MIQKFKSLAIALALATGLNAAVPTRSAEAGIIFLPFGVGVVFLVIGLVYNNLGLIILDADGSPNQGALEKTLAEKYSFVDDRAVISELASTIREKAASTRADAEGRRTVRLERAEVLRVLEPTGLVELEPEQVEKMVADLG